jgi:DNA-binding CsgD family transcriptional regulator
VMQLPATSVLAQISARLGKASARQELQDVLECALGTREPQRIAPVRIALAEAAWLAGDMDGVYGQVESALSNSEAVQAWDLGELHCWAHRAGHPILPLPEGMPEPIQLECSGNLNAAAEAYGRIGMPFEQAVVLAIMEGVGPAKPLDQVNLIIQSVSKNGQWQDEPFRGQYAIARTHPAGLTYKEQQILRLLSEGASNALMAATLNRSVRTVEHHVSAVLSKLGVTSRSAAASSVHLNPNLLSGMQDA